MLRSLSGFKANYHYLTLVVVSELNEWKVMLYGPSVTIHGRRQFQEGKAKEHALAIAQDYVHQQKKEDLPALSTLEWTPTSHDDWLIWGL